MNDVSKILVALIVLATIAVVVSSRQTATLVTGLGQFLKQMTGNVESS